MRDLATCAVSVALAVTSAAACQDVLQTPVSVDPSFNPLPAMWGVQTLGVDTRVDDIDESFVLYVRERARFVTNDDLSQVYFAEGKQLLTERPLSAGERAAATRTHGCLCALEYDNATSGDEIHTAAGIYAASAAPSVTADPSGVTRIVVDLSPSGQTGPVTLRRLVCWSDGAATLASMQSALPGFAVLARKRHPGFLDPPMDTRPVLQQEVQRRIDRGQRVVFDVPHEPDATQATTIPTRTLQPGIRAIFAPTLPGEQVVIDDSDYFLDLGPWVNQLDRDQGVYFRVPGWFP